jgi:hypothetical protein
MHCPLVQRQWFTPPALDTKAVVYPLAPGIHSWTWQQWFGLVHYSRETIVGFRTEVEVSYWTVLMRLHWTVFEEYSIIEVQVQWSWWDHRWYLSACSSPELGPELDVLLCRWHCVTCDWQFCTWTMCELAYRLYLARFWVWWFIEKKKCKTTINCNQCNQLWDWYMSWCVSISDVCMHSLEQNALWHLLTITRRRHCAVVDVGKKRRMSDGGDCDI